MEDKKYIEYVYNKQTKEVTQTELKEPADLWYIKAERGNEVFYFPTCASFSKWHGGNCATSGAYTRAGRYRDWRIYFFM